MSISITLQLTWHSEGYSRCGARATRNERRIEKRVRLANVFGAENASRRGILAAITMLVGTAAEAQAYTGLDYKQEVRD